MVIALYLLTQYYFSRGIKPASGARKKAGAVKPGPKAAPVQGTKPESVQESTVPVVIVGNVKGR